MTSDRVIDTIEGYLGNWIMEIPPVTDQQQEICCGHAVAVELKKNGWL